MKNDKSGRLVRIICVLAFIAVLVIDYSASIVVDVLHRINGGMFMVLFSAMFIATATFIVLLSSIYKTISKEDNIGISALVWITGLNIASTTWSYYLNKIKASDILEIGVKCDALLNAVCMIAVINIAFTLVLRVFHIYKFRYSGIRDRVISITIWSGQIALLIYIATLYYQVYSNLKIII